MEYFLRLSRTKCGDAFIAQLVEVKWSLSSILRSVTRRVWKLSCGKRLLGFDASCGSSSNNRPRFTSRRWKRSFHFTRGRGWSATGSDSPLSQFEYCAVPEPLPPKAECFTRRTKYGARSAKRFVPSTLPSVGLWPVCDRPARRPRPVRRTTPRFARRSPAHRQPRFQGFWRCSQACCGRAEVVPPAGFWSSGISELVWWTSRHSCGPVNRPKGIRVGPRIAVAVTSADRGVGPPDLFADSLHPGTLTALFGRLAIFAIVWFMLSLVFGLGACGCYGGGTKWDPDEWKNRDPVRAYRRIVKKPANTKSKLMC